MTEFGRLLNVHECLDVTSGRPKKPHSVQYRDKCVKYLRRCKCLKNVHEELFLYKYLLHESIVRCVINTAYHFHGGVRSVRNAWANRHAADASHIEK